MVANSSDDLVVMSLETDSESNGRPGIEHTRDSLLSQYTPLDDTEKSPPSLQQAQNMLTEGDISKCRQIEKTNITSQQRETVNEQIENAERKTLRGKRILGKPSTDFSVVNAAGSVTSANFQSDVSDKVSSYKKEHKVPTERHLTSSAGNFSMSANLRNSSGSRTEVPGTSTSTDSERGEKRSYDQEVHGLEMMEDSVPELADNISQLHIGNSHKKRSPTHTPFPSELRDHQPMESREQPTKSRDQTSECRDKSSDIRDQCNESKDQLTESKEKSNRIIKCLEHLSGEELYDLLNKQDDDGDNLLILSIIESCTSLSFTIIRVTPSISLLNLRNKLGQSALHVSVLTRQPLVTRRLVLAGADVLMRDVHGNTPLHTACAHDDLDAAIALTKRISTAERVTNNVGGDSNRRKNCDGRDLIGFQGGMSEYEGYLDYDRVTEEGASTDRTTRARHMLTEEGASTDRTTRARHMSDGIHVTRHWAMQPSHHHKSLSIPHPQPQQKPQHVYNYRGDTPAHIAAQHGNTDLVRYLLETTGADVNCPHGRCGRTLLHVASELGHTNTLRYLLSLPGTDRHAVTYAGQGALDLAVGRRQGKIVRMLRKAGVTFQYEEMEEDYTEEDDADKDYLEDNASDQKKDIKEKDIYDLNDFKLNMKSRGKQCESLMYDDICVSGRFLQSDKY